MDDSRHPTPTGKTALAPDVRRLDDRAARAWTERMAVRPLGSGRYAVDSQSGATYVVDVTAGTCTCPDHEIRGERCKHLRRVGIEITARRVPPPGRRRASCAACGVETFVPESERALALCPACRVEPGELVRDRETGDRLVVARVTDERAHERVIEAVGETVADYETNAGYPRDDLVVEAVYLGDLADESGTLADRSTESVLRSTLVENARRYSFPRSRLARVADRRTGDRDPTGADEASGGLPSSAERAITVR